MRQDSGGIMSEAQNTLVDAIVAAAADLDAIAIESSAQGRYSYHRFHGLIYRYAHALVSLGVRPGDRVAVQVDKSVDAIALYLATVASGAVFLPLNTAYTAREVAYFLQDATPRLLVCDPASSLPHHDAITELALSIRTLDAHGGGSLAALAEVQPRVFKTVPRSGDDLAAILYTSGTTGRSKGAMLSHNNLLSNARTLVDHWQFSESDVLIHTLPVYHTHGLFVATNVALLANARMLFEPQFSVEAVLSHLPSATAMMGVPTHYVRLLQDQRLSASLTHNMRVFISGSAPLLEETFNAFHARTGHCILERYGMTETSMSLSNPYSGERIAGTVGQPLPGLEARIVDIESQEPSAVGEIGMLEVRGPHVFQGYWQMPEKTAAEFRDDGFFITGDLARCDERGYFSIVGRGKDLIISGGLNVYPKEVELCLDRLEGVVESAVVGVPHPDFGEAVVAVVVPAQGVEIDESALGNALVDQLAKFKQPKRIITVSELPRNTMGKVQKNVLREQYQALFA